MSDFQIEVSALVDVQMNLITSEELDQESSEYTFNIGTTKPIEVDEHKYASNTRIEISRVLEEKEDGYVIHSIIASYATLFTSDSEEDDLLNHSKEISKVHLWPQLASLLSILSAQMRMTYPPLPLDPGDIATLDD